jgi:hypothetical protein
VTRAQAASAATISLGAELSAGMRPLAKFDLGVRTVEVLAGRDSLWALVRRPGRGALALRIAHCWGGCTKVVSQRARADERLRFRVDSPIGRQIVILRSDDLELSVLRVTTTLTPKLPLLIPYFPRDLYPLGLGDDPLQAEGKVEAAQRGLNSGLCYFHLDTPAFGSVLYFQNLTALNAYYAATKTKPDGSVGGEWPELGYLPPTPPQSGTPPTNPLPSDDPPLRPHLHSPLYRGRISGRDGTNGDHRPAAKLCRLDGARDSILYAVGEGLGEIPRSRAQDNAALSA